MALQPDRSHAGSFPASVGGATAPAPNASRGNDAAAEARGAATTSGAARAPVGHVAAAAASSTGEPGAAPSRAVPEPRTWALFGVGLLAVLMMARRQRRQHD